MRNTYIARQAILNQKLDTIGYELLFRDSPDNKFPEIEQDIASSKLIIQNHIHGDIQTLSMGKLAFINFTENCLVRKYPLLFDKNSIVIELVGHEKPTKGLLKIIMFYREHGYSIALTEYDLAPHWEVLFPYIDIIKINIEKINTKRLPSVVDKMKQHDIKISAERVETKLQKQTLAEVGFDYFQGYFYHQPEIIEGRTLTSIKAQMLALLNESFSHPLNFTAISEIVGHDVNLSIALLKMVNNVATGTKIEITSLKQAASYLGEDKLRQFVSILALSNLTSDCSDEICRQALITGKVMAALSNKATFTTISDYAFMTGLLSSLEVMLSMPMAEILKSMPVAKPIKLALISREGLLGELLSLTVFYVSGKDNDENANSNMANLMTQHALTQQDLQQEFLLASQWCKALNI
ncbi:HDOD domain-containing protein [Colwellia sp. D2M02]|uniref:EAL and HDOD domain-containing protein n=1 Tax=Colwellia sp. D2M02 TaxID=2841562 RepID=UPI001C0A0298|nr:HDOD domain-containing protein [Colwellia sp. D2M02]MBU2894938.1 HDOD domain-containing protein [Colwellia sp. D2M02]